ncbi:MAG: TlpA family protein disulfide reductase [Acidobacteria bacterium]|nr:TlpA family protein disulfide reductase [Acidobacteriota bacterium]
MNFRSVPSFAALGLAAALTIPAADIPRPTPDMQFKMPSGGVIDLAQYRGKVVVLEFLITTCPHCQKCSQILQKAQDEYGSKGFQALGVATNEMAHMLVPDYVKNFNLRFPIGFAPREQAHEFLQHPMMLIMYVPQLVFIDRKGVIRSQHAGGSDFFKEEEKNIRARVEELLKEPAAATSKAPAKAPAKPAAASKKAA